VLNPNVTKWLKGYMPKFSGKLEAASLEKLKSELIAGMEAGEGVPKLAKRMRGVFEDWDRQRAIDVAQNQAIRASSRAAIESYRQSGVVKKKVWLTTTDELVCDICLSLEGKVIELDENYFNLGDEETIGGRKYNFDYETIEGPPCHNRCRCSVSAWIEE